MASVNKVVDGEVVVLVIKPPQDVSASKLAQYLRDVVGIEGEVVGDAVNVVITVNRGELGDKADELANELMSKLNSINWSEVAKYKAPTAKAKKRRSRRRRSRKSRSKGSKKSSSNSEGKQ